MAPYSSLQHGDGVIGGHARVALEGEHRVPDRIEPVEISDVERVLHAEARLLQRVEHQLVAGVELVGRHVDADRARSLEGGELGVDLRIDHDRGELLLRLQRRFVDAAQDAEGIDRHRQRLGAGDIDAAKVVAELLVVGAPLALHPVAVDLHQRVAGDDGVGGVVPGAVDPAFVGLRGDLAERLDRLAQARLVEDRLVRRAVVEAVVDVRTGDRREQRMERVAGLEGVAADGDEGVAGVVHLLLVGPHVVERGPLGRIDAGRVGDLLVVVDHAVDMDGGRDLQHLAVDGDGVEHRLGEGCGGADLVEERSDICALALGLEVAEEVRVGRDEEVRRRAGDEEADERTLAGRLVRHRGGGNRVSLRLELRRRWC